MEFRAPDTGCPTRYLLRKPAFSKETAVAVSNVRKNPRSRTRQKENSVAQRITTSLVDDVDGSPIEDGRGGTVSFSLDGAFYEIDLNAPNAAKLHDDLLPFIAKARRASSRGARAAAPARGASKPDLTAARTWLRAQGHEVSARGRISASLLDEYRAAVV
jgi:Lsr2